MGTEHSQSGKACVAPTVRYWDQIEALTFSMSRSLFSGLPVIPDLPVITYDPNLLCILHETQEDLPDYQKKKNFPVAITSMLFTI